MSKSTAGLLCFVRFGALALICVTAGGCAGSQARGSSGPVRFAESPASGASGEREAQRLLRAPTLRRGALIDAVLARNPGIESVRQSYRAASARAPQLSALPDPMLMYEFAPLSIGSADAAYGQTVRLSQRFPWPGKLSGAADSAQASADAAHEAIEISELDLALQVSNLFDDYWLNARAIEINLGHQRLLSEIGASARARTAAGRGPMQDALAAEVASTRLVREKLRLDADRQSSRAQLNLLMRVAPSAKLPEPAARLDVAAEKQLTIDTPGSAPLQRQALTERAELRAASSQVRAAEASVTVAERGYYPDITLSGSYTSMFSMVEHQWMLGIELPLPLSQSSRGGAVDEASARAAQLRSQSAQVADRVRFEVDEGRRRLQEARETLSLYGARLLPLAKQQVAAALSAYQTADGSFAAVIDAEKTLRDTELAERVTLAQLSKRRAQLCRALGQYPHRCELKAAK